MRCRAANPVGRARGLALPFRRRRGHPRRTADRARLVEMRPVVCRVTGASPVRGLAPTVTRSRLVSVSAGSRRVAAGFDRCPFRGFRVAGSRGGQKWVGRIRADTFGFLIFKFPDLKNAKRFCFRKLSKSAREMFGFGNIRRTARNDPGPSSVALSAGFDGVARVVVLACAGR